MALPHDDSDFDGLDSETRVRRLNLRHELGVAAENLAAKRVGKPDAENPDVQSNGLGGETGSCAEPDGILLMRHLFDSGRGPSSTRAPTLIILLAGIAIGSIAAFFGGSGAFKPYATELFDFFSLRTSLAPASLPKEGASATAATSSHRDQVSAPNDLSRSPERSVAETQTKAPVAAAKSIAAPQTTASLPQRGRVGDSSDEL
jgi:hypothetical protein